MHLAANELYRFSIFCFLPKFRSRVRVLVDVSHAIQKPKELNNDLSEEAWDELNLSISADKVIHG